MKMLPKLLFISQLFSLALCQCMSLDTRNRTVRESHPDRSTIMNNTRLVDCIDECLADGIQACTTIVFDPLNKTCNIVKGIKADICGDCVVMTKRGCIQSIVDFQCFEPITYRNKKMAYLYGLETEVECRRICVILNNCRAYTWLKRINKCGIQMYTPTSKFSIEDDEISAKKKQNCNSNRCTEIKFNAVASRVKKRLAAMSVSQCYRKLLKNDHYTIVAWQFKENICRYHTTKVSSVHMAFKKQMLAVKQSPCQEKPDVCEAKIPNTMMPGGFPISDTDEQDCVTLCRHSVNCAAVTWSPDRTCRFHHVQRRMSYKPNWTTYEIAECLDKKLEKGDIHDTYYSWMGSKSSSHKFSSDCFKCALQCRIMECPGFRCRDNRGETALCSFGGNVREAYIPDF